MSTSTFTEKDIRTAARHIFAYVIHDLENHCDGNHPKCVLATSLKGAYIEAYKDNKVRLLLDMRADSQHLSGLDENCKPIDGFKVDYDEVYEALVAMDELQMVRVSDVIAL